MNSRSEWFRLIRINTSYWTKINLIDTSDWTKINRIDFEPIFIERYLELLPDSFGLIWNGLKEYSDSDSKSKNLMQMFHYRWLLKLYTCIR